MGVSYFTHIGPYLKVYNPEKESEEEIHSCPNKKCKNHKKGLSTKFCPECGYTVILVKIPATERIDTWDLEEEFDDFSLSEIFMREGNGMDDFNIFVSNRDNDFDYDIDATETGVFSISPEEFQGGKEDFRKLHEKDIEFLQQKFGTENVTLEWGVVTWCG